MAAVLGANSKRETGKRAQQNNIMAAKVRGAVCLQQHNNILSGRLLQRSCMTPGCQEPWYGIASLPHDLCSVLLQAVADIVRTTLGPRAMLKMLLDASGGAPCDPTALG